MCVQVMKESVQDNVKYFFCVTEEFVVIPQPEVRAEPISEEVKAKTGNVELSLPSRKKVLPEYFHSDFV